MLEEVAVAHPRTPRGAWIEEGLRVLGESGPEAVRVEVLAKRLTVTKGGFYGYFEDRQALLAEMLETWEEEVTDRIIEQVEAGGGDAVGKLQRMAQLVFEGDAVVTGFDIDLAVRDWARRDPDVAQRMRRVDDRKMAYLRSLYGAICQDEAEVELRATISFFLWIAGHLADLDHGARTAAEVRQLIVERLLF